MKYTQILLNQLKDKFDLDVSYVTWNEKLKVPPMIKLAYDTFYIKIEFIDFIAVVPKTDEDYFIKRLKVLENNHGAPIIFISESINAPMRKQLTSAKISYLSTNMIYLYPLLCYGENNIKKLHKRRIKLPIIVQPILLHMIYNNKIKEVYKLEDFKHLYKLTDSTIYRKIIVLEELNLIHKLENNTKKEFILNKDTSLEEVIYLMNSPIKSTTYIYSNDFERVIQNNECLISGESALNEFNLAVNKNNINFDPSKRNFFKTVGKAVTVIGAASMGISTDANAWSVSQLPPGIQIIEKFDPVLVSIYAEIIDIKGYKQYDKKDISRILSGKRGKINPKSPLEQPGYWFIVSLNNVKYNKYNNVNTTEFEEKIKNKNMDNWREGINDYFLTYNGYKSKYNLAKKYLAKTFVRACGKPENEWEELTDRIESQNYDYYIDDLKNNLSHSKNDTEKLLAAWSIFMLGINYYSNANDSRTKETDFLYYKIESDLFKRKITPKIRGRPDFLIL